MPSETTWQSSTPSCCDAWTASSSSTTAPPSRCRTSPAGTREWSAGDVRQRDGGAVVRLDKESVHPPQQLGVDDGQVVALGIGQAGDVQDVAVRGQVHLHRPAGRDVLDIPGLTDAER